MELSPIYTVFFGLWLCNAALGLSLPEPFHDRRLIPEVEYGEDRQDIEHLGSIAKLHTPISHHSSFKCKFTIETRHRRTEVAFEPTTQCGDNSCNEYQFDLKRLADSGFNSEVRTVILIAGFMSSDDVDWFDEIATNWLRAEDVNIIRVSWSDGDKYFYGRAVSGVPIVAREVTILLYYLAALNGKHFSDLDFASRVQIVGHSLGSHIAGFVGQDLGGNLGRITALDPAGPFFDKQKRQLRLDPTDARFVDSIHTNSGQIHYMKVMMSAPVAGLHWLAGKLPGIGNLEKEAHESASRDTETAWFGINQQVSHVDYYANNGRVQPGCETLMHICDHGRAHEIYRDLLAHETRLQTQFGAEARRKNRLLAFSADDYESFLVGASLNDRCPSVLDFNEHLDTEESLARCSLPLDLLATSDELVAEFRDKFGVSGLRGLEELSQQKYYFRTRSQRPLVGHHYMLKIHNGGGASAWSSACSLKAQITMPNGFETDLSLLETLEGPKSYDEGSFHISAIFVMPNKDNEPILDETDGITGNQSYAAKYLPQQVTLKIQGAPSASVTKALVSRVWDLISHKSSLDVCYKQISSIEIMPLIGSQHAVLGRYGDTAERLDAGTEITRHISDVIVN